MEDDGDFKQPHPPRKRVKVSSPSESSVASDNAENEVSAVSEPSINSTSLQKDSDLPGDVFMMTKTDLSTKFILDTLRAAEKGKHASNVITNPPIHPKAGSVFLYQTKSKEDKRFLDDQYFGLKRTGQKLLSGGIIRTYYQLTLRVPEEEETTEDDKDFKEKPPSKRVFFNFRRTTVWLEQPKNEDNFFVLLHYTGDETLYKAQPHGNAKHHRPFTRTSSEARTRIKNEVKDRNSAPTKVYECLIKEHFKETENRSFVEAEKYEKIDAPRDLQQVKNFKKSEARKTQISKCEVFSIYELARSDLSAFILKMELIPFDVIFAEPTLLQIANQLLKASNKDKSLPQLICYDTTFELADSFVSILVMRNIFLADDPIFPVAFMIHDRKLSSVHEAFWNTIKNVINLQTLTEGVPICTDREAAIVGAIRSILPRANLISCTNHIKQDVKFWVRKHGGNKDDESVLIQQITLLLESDSMDILQQYLEAFKEKWSEAFRSYYEEHLYDDIQISAKFNVQKFAAFDNSSPTNNLSESINSVIKKATDWKEYPIDTLLLKLIEMQCSYLREFNRAFEYIGKYRVKKEYQQMGKWKSPSYMYFTEPEFTALVKASVKPEENLQPNQHYTKEHLARLCIQNKLIIPIPEQQMWVVRSSYKPDISYNITRSRKSKSNKREFVCTCPSSVNCYHVLAVKISIGDDIDEDSTLHKLSVLKKKTRECKGKSGRKLPNPMDLIANVIEADDSELAGKKSMLPETQLKNSKKEDLQAVDNNGTVNAQELSSLTKGQHWESEDDEFGGIFLKELLPEFKKEETLYKTYPTLKPGKWIEGSIIDKVIRAMFNKYPTSNVLYIDEFLFETVRLHNDINHVANHSHANDGLNKDVVFTCVTTGVHWMLGAIIFRSKTICLFDSLFHKTPKENRRQSFEYLLKIANAIFATASEQVVQFEWKLIYASDVPRQDDESECGVNVCLMAYSFIQQIPFPTTKTVCNDNHVRNRRWMLHVLEWSKDKKSPSENSRRLQPEVKSYVKEQQTNFTVIRDDINKSQCVKLVNDALKLGDGSWTLCNDSSCSGDDEHMDKQILCILCRNWYHQSHLDVVPADLPTYYKCQHCLKIPKVIDIV